MQYISQSDSTVYEIEFYSDQTATQFMKVINSYTRLRITRLSISLTLWDS